MKGKKNLCTHVDNERTIITQIKAKHSPYEHNTLTV